MDLYLHERHDANVDYLDSQQGLYLTPSPNVPERPKDVTGYVLGSCNDYGKIVWIDPKEFTVQTLINDAEGGSIKECNAAQGGVLTYKGGRWTSIPQPLSNRPLVPSDALHGPQSMKFKIYIGDTVEIKGSSAARTAAVIESQKTAPSNTTIRDGLFVTVINKDLHENSTILTNNPIIVNEKFNLTLTIHRYSNFFKVYWHIRGQGGYLPSIKFSFIILNEGGVTLDSYP